MPDLMSAALFERDARALVVHRRAAPFAGQWTLPLVIVRDDEAAEDALRRHALEQFGLTLAEETFVETVYLTDPVDAHQYVANIFRAPLSGAPMRFNAEGEYDDAHWLAATDLDALLMPPDLRVPLAKILADPGALHETDWTLASVEATPLGETATALGAPPAAPPAPDNLAAWDTIAGAWQVERYGDRFGERLMWSRRASEDDLHVLDDVHGKRAIVLGCGGGQDVVALSKLGALATGIDASPKQLAYAQKYSARHSAENAAFVEGNVEDLSRFDDESFDLAVSIDVLDYVAEADVVMREAARVLKGGGVLAFAVKHPFEAHVDAGPPYTVWTSYWSRTNDWTMSFKDGTRATFRSYFRTMADWFALIADAGFAIERIIEPKEDALRRAEGDDLDDTWLRLLPYALVMKARKR